MDPIRQIQRLGWEWRPDGLGQGLGPGVVLAVKVDGKTIRAFVPLARVWLTFDQELSAVGCVGCASVGAPFTVGGLFSSIKKAVSGAAKSVVKKVVPKAIQKAATRVVNTAKQAVRTVAKIPGVKQIASVYKAGFNLVTLPQQAALRILSGQRIDKAGLATLQSAVKSARTVAPYVQTVMSLVPGVGTGISAGLGGALALAQGQPISEALLAAVRSAVPGGPAAQAAFAVASGALQGKPIDQIAINALPLDPSAKQAITRGLALAKDVAAGKNVAAGVLDTALNAVPPQYRTAIQTGVAMGRARSLQGLATSAVHSAANLAGTHAAGIAAAQQIARGARSPQLLAAVQRATTARNALTHVVQQANRGHTQAASIVHALNAFRRNPMTFARP